MRGNEMKKINKKTLPVSLAIIAAVCVIFGIVLLLASPKSGGSANIANGSFESLDSSGLIPKGWEYTSYLNDTSVSNAVVVKDAARGNVVKLTNAELDDAHFTQTVSVQAITAKHFDKSVVPLRLLWRDFRYHRQILLSC